MYLRKTPEMIRIMMNKYSVLMCMQDPIAPDFLADYDSYM
jgi:hypothetical protein